MHEHGGADHRQLRRLAQGRARDRREHGAVRGARVGREGDRDDVAVKSLADPTGSSSQGSCSTASPGCTCATSRPAARDRARSPPSASSAASVSPSARAAISTTTPRQRIVLRREMARQPEGSPVLEALARAVRVRRDRDLRGRRHRAGAPARSGSTRASSSSSCAAGSAPTARSAWRACSHAAAARSSGPRGAACGRHGAPAADRRAAARRRSRGGPPARQRRPRPGAPAAPAAACAGAASAAPRAAERPPSICPPASTGSSAIPAGAQAAPTLPEALLAVSARAGLPLWIPPRRRRSLLRDAVELQGLPAGARAHGREDRGCAVAMERRRDPTRRDRCELMRARPARARLRVPPGRDARAVRAHHDPRLDRVDARSAASQPADPPQGSVGCDSPDLLGGPSGADREARGDRPRAGRAGRHPAGRRLLRDGRRPRTCCTPSSLPPPCATSPPSSSGTTSRSTCPATGRASSASSRSRERPYRSFVFLLERLSRR